MFLEHRGERPKIYDSAYVAPNATLCGDVTVGENVRVMFGAVLTAEGGPVDIGANCVVMENAVVRGTKRHPPLLPFEIVTQPVFCRLQLLSRGPPAFFLKAVQQHELLARVGEVEDPVYVAPDPGPQLPEVSPRYLLHVRRT